MEEMIMLATLVRNRQWVIPYYLDHIYYLNYPKSQIHIYWLINNSTDSSEKILWDFKKKHEHEYASIEIDYYSKNPNMPQDERSNEIRLRHTYQHLSNLRNYVFSRMEKSDCSYLLSVDSDILVRPDTLSKLKAADKSICAGIIFNGYKVNPSEPWRYPNILKILSDGSIQHIANSYIKNSPTLIDSKIAKVGATGAICLMSRDVCKNTRYSWHVQGEDIAWALDCAKKGYELYADYSAFNYHIMDQEMLDEHLSANAIN